MATGGGGGRGEAITQATHKVAGIGLSLHLNGGMGLPRWEGRCTAGVPVPASGNAIALRRAGDGIERSAEPRFGGPPRAPQGALVARDGGLSEAASGDLAIAAVTSWSRARAFAATTCAVPVGAAAPTDASVRALSHPDAYPITFVTLKRLGLRPGVRPITAAFLKYLTGPLATTSFRTRGMLLVKGDWPAVSAPAPPPGP